MLGNLARATYVGSSDWVWPFSYDKCDQSKTKQQEINACRKISHYGMKPGIGRGAPEIDILEAMGGEAGHLPSTPIQRPYFSSSLQVRCLHFVLYYIFDFIYYCYAKTRNSLRIIFPRGLIIVP